MLASEELDVVTPLEEIDGMINEILRVLPRNTADTGRYQVTQRTAALSIECL